MEQAKQRGTFEQRQAEEVRKLRGAQNVRNLGDVKWCATEDGSAGKGTGRHIACFVLTPNAGVTGASGVFAAKRPRVPQG